MSAKTVISNCAIRFHVNRSLEFDNPFSRIAVRSLEVRSLGLQFVPSNLTIRFLGLQFVPFFFLENPLSCLRGDELQFEGTRCVNRGNKLQSERTYFLIEGTNNQSVGTNNLFVRTDCTIRYNELHMGFF